MPFDATLVIMIIGLIIAVAVWLRTRRAGPVIAVVFTAFFVIALTDRSVLAQGGAAVGDLLTWIFDTLLTF